MQIDRWWLEQHRELHEIGVWLRTKTFADLDAQDMQQLKRRGFSDEQLARLLGACLGIGMQEQNIHSFLPVSW